MASSRIPDIKELIWDLLVSYLENYKKNYNIFDNDVEKNFLSKLITDDDIYLTEDELKLIKDANISEVLREIIPYVLLGSFRQNWRLISIFLVRLIRLMINYQYNTLFDVLQPSSFQVLSQSIPLKIF